jgi:hypothetical protein
MNPRPGTFLGIAEELEKVARGKQRSRTWIVVARSNRNLHHRTTTSIGAQGTERVGVLPALSLSYLGGLAESGADTHDLRIMIEGTEFFTTGRQQ